MKMTNLRNACLWLLFVTSLCCPAVAEQGKANPENTVLWYKQPAETFAEALPLGNGRLGAMVFGNPAKERILLNEETVWTGGPYNPTNLKGAANIDEIRKQVFQGNYALAHRLFGRYMMGTPVEQMKYQPLGNLNIEFPDHEEVTNYRRDLDIDSATATVSYTLDGVKYKRETFVTPVDQVIVTRISADKPGKVSLTARMTGCRNSQHSNYGAESYRIDSVGNDGLQLYGQTATYLGVKGRVKFFARAKFFVDGGKTSSDFDSITVDGADSVTIMISAATNFVSFKDLSADEKSRTMGILNKAVKKPYAKMKSDHVAAHRKLFRRVDLELPSTASAKLPTDERLKKFVAGGDDPQLAALYFQFGRYLLIASSRPGTKPANLQGIWNEEMNPKWDSKYTVNINLEMNYWPVEVANLSECAEPLVDMMCEITEPGAYTAKKSYGARGWVLHQNTDIWWPTAPMDGTAWGTFSTGGAWLCTHLWERYLYNQDEKYLARVYPVLRGASLFFLDTLVMHPTEKVLVTCPATSPENFPKRPGNRIVHDEAMGGDIMPNICAGPTMDTQIIRDLFNYTIAAAKILGKDGDLQKELTETLGKMAPMKIGRFGQLQEWVEDLDDPDDDHRHFSHLYGMYPSCQISLRKTPKLAAAVKQSVTSRGDYGTGFSMAWKMNLWARLLDGDRCLQLFRNQMEKQTCPNLFSICFTTPQVEGTLGACAGIAEMLMQSYEDEIHLLPALPKAWPEGTLSGLRARGGFTVDMKWKGGKLVEAKIGSKRGGPCKVRYGEKVIELDIRPGTSRKVSPKDF